MRRTKKWLFIGGGAIIVLGIVAGIGVWHFRTAVRIVAFPIDSKDPISSWSFTGAYTGNDTLTQQANADIAHLSSLLGKGKYDDYDLYLGIGNDDNLLGNGEGAYENYNYSIAIHPNKGLAYDNLGHLMDELGAYYTAADAYAKAVAVESAVLQYQLAQLDYLTTRFATDTPRIQTALKSASDQFGDTPSVLEIEAQWLSGQGKYTDAITALKAAIQLSPGQNTSNLQAEIVRLQAKESQ